MPDGTPHGGKGVAEGRAWCAVAGAAGHDLPLRGAELCGQEDDEREQGEPTRRGADDGNAHLLSLGLDAGMGTGLLDGGLHLPALEFLVTAGAQVRTVQPSRDEVEEWVGHPLFLPSAAEGLKEQRRQRDGKSREHDDRAHPEEAPGGHRHSLPTDRCQPEQGGE